MKDERGRMKDLLVLGLVGELLMGGWFEDEKSQRSEKVEQRDR